MKILIRILAAAAALGVAALVVPGIRLSGHNDVSKALTLVVVAVVFGVINAVLKPVIRALGCGLYVLTLGLIAIVVNGLLLWLASFVASSELHRPFHVAGFVPAVEGALIVGVVTWVVQLLVDMND